MLTISALLFIYFAKMQEWWKISTNVSESSVLKSLAHTPNWLMEEKLKQKMFTFKSFEGLSSQR